MNNSTTVRLICVLIDDDLKIRDSPFTIKVPTDGEISDVIRYVQEVTPSLKDRDHGKFSFFKPPSESPVYVSNSTHGLQLSRKHLGSSLCIIDKVSMFQEKGDNCRSNIDVVIHVGSGEHGGPVLHTLPRRSDNSLLHCVTFCLRNRKEVQLPPEARLKDNNISELPMDEVPPDFIQQLERDLHLQRSPGHDTTTRSLLDSVKVLLGDEAFQKYFTGPNDETEMRRVTAVELLHYLDTLVDQHLSSKEAYRGRAASHMYSLLRRFAITSPPPRSPMFKFDVPWYFGLVVEVGQTLHKYTPRSDIFMSIEDFPHLLIEISSDKTNKRDKSRMLLQAACLVRLGNRLITDNSSTFFVKAIYINYDYHADEYTLYQKGSEPDKVEYCKRPFNFSNRRDLFTLVFRTYNLLHSTRALHARLPRLSEILSNLQTETEAFPFAMSRKRGAEGPDSSGFSKRRNQQSGPSSMVVSTSQNRSEGTVTCLG
ncbi:hypothetical protein BJY52DRAFT_1197588 [Lactarius psammicola]|nr:hypothetical protein BJY52DRAFT_1197588 [Lactarius psammicola]